MRLHCFALIAAASVALSGCALGGARLTGDQQLELIRRLGEYGCGGSLEIDAGGGVGQLGGEAHGSFNFQGTCPTRQPPT